MAIELIQSAQSQTNGSSTTPTFPSTPKSGNVLIAFAYTNSNSTVLDIPGWTANERTYSGTAQTIGIFHKVSNDTETSVTANGNTITRLHISEWTGLLVPVEVEGVASNISASSVGISTGNVAMTSIHSLCVSAGGISASGTRVASWTNSFVPLLQDATAPRLFSAYRINYVRGTYFSVANLNDTNSNSAAMIVGFKGEPPIRDSKFMNFF